ncbi:hypothetical protein GCM10022291_16600 [Postechiella marina]|uniref:Lipoprotein n=2 Tax=Postechiella marina TaxID=943941 RepID=A0ABP8C8K0_9FLAO
MSCGQKSNNKQKEITLDTLQHTHELKNKANKIDKKVINEIEDTNSDISNYICYTNNNNKSKKIWIGFNNSNKAMKIKYNGQSESIPLKFVRNEYIEGGTQPTIIDYYNEIYNGEINGHYKLTKSGNWYYVLYTRGKDNKEFNFTVDHTMGVLSSKPCF